MALTNQKKSLRNLKHLQVPKRHCHQLKGGNSDNVDQVDIVIVDDITT